ncbi:MraY family glycosyltransferase [Aquifex aeolicus]|nr:glycosyltransferase [Aquifex aeolicus]
MSAFPVFFSGLLEDITKKVSPKWRLLIGFISGILAFYLISAKVTRVDIPFVDSLLSIPLISLLFTAFALAGVSHAFNIIDGFNGLASGVAMLVFGAYAYVSFLHNDLFLVYLNLLLIAATLGFFLWNYPFGLIFLGDGGAYFLGFCAGAIGAILVNKYPDISPWFPMLLVIYPVWETLFSIYRRKFLKDYPPHMPDALHFHQLLYRRLLKFTLGSNIEPFKRNSYTSPFLWVMELICLVPAVLFWDNTPILMLFTFAFIVFYTWLYFRIVKFKTPKIFRIK